MDCARAKIEVHWGGQKGPKGTIFASSRGQEISGLNFFESMRVLLLALLLVRVWAVTLPCETEM